MKKVKNIYYAETKKVGGHYITRLVIEKEGEIGNKELDYIIEEVFRDFTKEICEIYHTQLQFFGEIKK